MLDELTAGVRFNLQHPVELTEISDNLLYRRIGLHLRRIQCLRDAKDVVGELECECKVFLNVIWCDLCVIHHFGLVQQRTECKPVRPARGQVGYLHALEARRALLAPGEQLLVVGLDHSGLGSAATAPVRAACSPL